MSVRILTASGALELGGTADDAPPCDRCPIGPASLAIDVDFHAEHGELFTAPRRTVNLCRACLAMRVAQGEAFEARR